MKSWTFLHDKFFFLLGVFFLENYKNLYTKWWKETLLEKLDIEATRLYIELGFNWKYTVIHTGAFVPCIDSNEEASRIA